MCMVYIRINDNDHRTSTCDDNGSATEFLRYLLSEAASSSVFVHAQETTCQNTLHKSVKFGCTLKPESMIFELACTFLNRHWQKGEKTTTRMSTRTRENNVFWLIRTLFFFEICRRCEMTASFWWMAEGKNTMNLSNDETTTRAVD